ncbi:hypothetical protein O181_045328 [Austropuccinia psidii MF-1]|uniref:Reverse transcriptase domain-containing protein n=1 Tax=Austropuccinia psidii MF-1 TaxID=1389203 RepID=A0A9Q3HHI5_9BASI|nr:hypothetical protein [Austropuccinia psidii MF-1]
MPFQHSPPARWTRSQARAQAVLTLTPRVPLDGTPAAPQLRAHLDRGPVTESAEPSRKEGRGPRRSISFSGVVGSFPGPLSKVLITQIMANLQEASRPRDLKTPSMKEPDCFYGTQPFKFRSFIQSFQLIFHNDKANFSEGRKKLFYSISFPIGRDAKWFEPYLSNLTNQDLAYLLNNWALFESQLFTLFGDPNEVRKSESELDGLIMEEGGHLPSSPSFEWDFLVIDTPKEEDLILGFYFLNHFNPSIDWRKGLITFNADHKDYYDPSKSSSNEFSSSKSYADLVCDSRTPSFASSVQIPSLNSPQSLLPSKDEVFKKIQDLREDNSVYLLYLFFGNMNLPPSAYHDSPEKLWDEEEEPEEIETMMNIYPSIYHYYLNVFPNVKADKLPPHCACDNHIELEGSLPPLGMIYSLSNQESDTLKAYILDNLEKFFIQPSSSSTGAPVLFVKKKNGGLRLCVDYCKLNSVTRKNKYPFPPMNQILTVFDGSSIFSKIYLHGAYNLLRIKEGDEHLTAFRTKYGSYEYLVMPFGLTNDPASFENLVNDIFYYLLDIYVVVYLDDIMIFSKSEEEHVTHVSTVLSRLRANNLFAKASKFLFHVSSVEYLGYVVFSKGLKIDQAKVQQILNWPPPRNLKALQSFRGFSSFYCRFIKNYSKKISSLTEFLKKDSCFPLNWVGLGKFHQLKEAFTTAPILLYPPL